MIEPIQIPDTALEPAAYARALVATLGDRQALEVRLILTQDRPAHAA